MIRTALVQAGFAALVVATCNVVFLVFVRRLPPAQLINLAIADVALVLAVFAWALVRARSGLAPAFRLTAGRAVVILLGLVLMAFLARRVANQHAEQHERARQEAYRR